MILHFVQDDKRVDVILSAVKDLSVFGSCQGE